MQCADCDAKASSYWQERNGREARELRDVRLLDSGLPKRFRDGRVTWNGILAAIGPLARCVDVLDRGEGLYLHGPAGTYKTSLAAAYLAREIRRGSTGIYVYVPDLFSELAAIYSGDDGRSRADVIDRYASAPILVVDDLDKSAISRHGAEILLAIFDRRYRNEMRRMIVTANVPPDKLAAPFAAAVGENFAEPLLRRISEMTTTVRTR